MALRKLLPKATTTFFRSFVRNYCNKKSGSSGEEDVLKKIVAEKIKEYKELILKFKKEHGKTVVSEVRVEQIYGGMRGIPAIICETSELHGEQGITFRGLSIPDLYECVPTSSGWHEPLPEAVFWLMITGDLPTEENTRYLSKQWACRSNIPDYVEKMLDNLPKDVHPMAQLSAALTLCSRESEFAKAYHKGIKKDTYWEYVYEDAMNLLAKIPGLAAKIYNHSYKKGGKLPEIDPEADWSKNYATMMDFKTPEFHDLMRMYLSMHCDHEGANVSAHTTHLVGSALSDPYLAYGAGLNGLAGPLHGLASQECLEFLQNLMKAKGDSPTDDQIKEFVNETLKSGRVVPGFGHAVLRNTDPRFIAEQNFYKKHVPDDPMCQIVEKLHKLVPPILKGLGKVANPYPNVDAHSGALLQAFCVKEMEYYTVMFGVSRALGVMAQLIWSRAAGFPIERPKSLTTETLMAMIKTKKAKKVAPKKE